MVSLNIDRADLTKRADQQAVLSLLEGYARDPMGLNGRFPLPGGVIEGLRNHPTTHVFVARERATPAGLAVCFLGFSTFAAKPLLNVHDFFVAPAARGKGVGAALLGHVEAAARAMGCCRLTLEVRADNHPAKRLYQRVGFDPTSGVPGGMGFWVKGLV
ncbi:putative acetyltransferase [Planctomycetes bacterium Pan216]|uniref:Putative acetyltransferase n=1 Tax=Kolteria novifilia TaxID=2527975 RepID=A0A518B3A7_9BACT|nr:putative acetyltransferase [Planctomycetes bacterium Pan216]